MRKELSETEVITTVKEIRIQAPGIGAYKLFLMLRELYPEEMRGRDWFYRLMHENHLMLKPQKRRHTTNSNHNYRRYKNLIKGMAIERVNQLWVADACPLIVCLTQGLIRFYPPLKQSTLCFWAQTQ